MKTKLTILLDKSVYDGLKSTIGRGKIGKFLNDLAKPFVLKENLEAGYKALKEDSVSDREAKEWIKNTTGLIKDDNLWQF